jgi:hypothetical protein
MSVCASFGAWQTDDDYAKNNLDQLAFDSIRVGDQITYTRDAPVLTARFNF